MTYWGLETLKTNRSSEPLALYFTNRRFVYLGLPNNGLRRCHRVTAKRQDGEYTEGCLKYTYNRATGRVRFGRSTGRLKGRTLSFEFRDGGWSTVADRWNEAPLPRPGRRFNVELVDRGWSGFCGPMGGCVTWTCWLRLDRKGRFGMANSMIGSIGGGGGGAWGALANDQKGRYRVLSRGRIRLAYASGKKEIRTIAIQRNRKNGKPDPARTGILFGDARFAFDRD